MDLHPAGPAPAIGQQILLAVAHPAALRWVAPDHRQHPTLWSSCPSDGSSGVGLAVAVAFAVGTFVGVAVAAVLAVALLVGVASACRLVGVRRGVLVAVASPRTGLASTSRLAPPYIASEASSSINPSMPREIQPTDIPHLSVASWAESHGPLG